jgi:AcrR family transcriptional regulator
MFTFGESVSPTRRPAAEGLRERNKREKLARIRKAARELFEKKGFEGATAREICRRARVGTGTLFLYVRDKRELVFLVFRDEARELLREGMARTREDMPLPEALMCVFGAFLEFYARNTALAEVIAAEFFYRARGSAEMAALTEEYLACIAELVERARARGSLRTDVPVAEQVNAFFAHYAAHVLAWFGDPAMDQAAAARALRRALALQIEGLAPRPPRARRGERTAAAAKAAKEEIR